ncbi:MAG TPA: NFACT RNA binding domain-containing protein [Ignavibacteriaceae bacterium]|nr:NFACT RNA binding domain-containing protein [Ignavibacteriaceae bacterium]
MLKNYFFLKRFLIEAENELTGLRAQSVFSQEKDKLIIQFSPGDSQTGGKFIEISSNPGSPYLSLKKNFTRARKNTIDFFKEYFPSKFISAEIAEFDRVIRFNFEKASVYFLIRGKFTNAILIPGSGDVIPFKKAERDFLFSFDEEVKKTSFISPHLENHFNFNSISSENFIIEIKKRFPVFGSEILSEIKLRESDKSKEKFFEELNTIITEISKNKPSVFINKDTKEIKLSADTFKLFSEWEITRFDTLIDAVNFYLNRKQYLGEVIKNENLIKKNIEKKLARLSGKLNNIKTFLERGSREEEYKKKGNILLINLKSLKKGMKEAELEDIYNENNFIKIKLNEELPPQGNINHYFDLAKKERAGYEKSKQMFKELNIEHQKLMKKKEEMESLEEEKNNLDGFKKLRKELKIKEESQSPSEKDDLKEKFKHYIIEGNYHAYVGKDSANNDLLTLKFAKQNDYWFHARGASGSHLVLKAENPSQKIPKNILKAAASIAAFHSKAKTSGLAPVSFTQKKYVIKKKGMEPGKVALMREEVLIVRPEIPKNAVFISKQME